MFKKNKCKKCRSKISRKDNFCPSCGTPIDSKNEDWGMLGKNDSQNIQNQPFNSMLGGISGNMINKMLNSAMKMLEKEMQKEMKTQNLKPKTNIRLMINGKEINLNNQQKSENPKKIKQINLPQSKLKNFSKLPRIEPKTNLRRLADKIVYEIELKGVKSIKDISIMKLENSIEIKAITKDKAYFKIIPLNLPIINYNILKEKLILEFGVKN